MTRTPSVDSNANKLEARLDGSSADPSTSSLILLASPLRRRKTRCSGADTAVASKYPTRSGLSDLFPDPTTLATTLPYPTISGDLLSLPSTFSPSNASSRIEPIVSSRCAPTTVTVTSEPTVTVTTYAVSVSVTLPSITAVAASSPVAPSSLFRGNGSTPTNSSKRGNSTVSPYDGEVFDEKPVPSATSLTLGDVGGAAQTAVHKTVGTTTGTSPSSTTSNTASDTATSANQTSNAQTWSAALDHTGEFWAGAGIDTVLRAKALPGRTFYDYDGKTVGNPIKTPGGAGLNSFRVQTFRGDCVGPESFVNSATSLPDELHFKLDFGCIATKVETAKWAKAAGMRLMGYTINQGLKSPKGMEQYTYQQMIEEVQKETKHAGIVPDIILLENEGADGFLFHEEATGHDRGETDGELCGQAPTGKMNSYTQYSGYLTAEVLACNEAIQAAGFSSESVRYGLHSHRQFVQWKESTVPTGGPRPRGRSGTVRRAKDRTPSPTAALRATLSRLEQTFTQLQGYTEDEFPNFQALGVEYTLPLSVLRESAASSSSGTRA
ncbi:MAG: hypothetical protein Q9173_002246 [Seirophora scorigena]